MEHAISFRFQAILACITVALLVGLSYFPIREFYPLDKGPQLLPLTPKKTLEFGGVPAAVKVGLTITDFAKFDIVNNEFNFSGSVWFEFDPSVTALETVGKFAFEKGEILYKSAPSTKIIEGKLFARYDIRVRFGSSLDYHFFPFDMHRIFLVLTNDFVSPGEIIFQSSSRHFNIAENIQILGWKQQDFYVKTGYAQSILDVFKKNESIDHPRVEFSIDYIRMGLRYRLSILLPLFLLLFISYFSLSFDLAAYKSSVLGATLGSVTGLLSYRFVIDNLSPKVGYFMLSDYVFSIILVETFIVFLVHAIGRYLSVTIKKIILISLHVVIIITWVYLFGFWHPR